MIVKLLTEHHLKFLSLKEDCRASSESTLVKMSNCWKSHALAQFLKCFCPNMCISTDKVERCFGRVFYHFTIVGFKNTKINFLKKKRFLLQFLLN